MRDFKTAVFGGTGYRLPWLAGTSPSVVMRSLKEEIEKGPEAGQKVNF